MHPTHPRAFGIDNNDTMFQFDFFEDLSIQDPTSSPDGETSAAGGLSSGRTSSERVAEAKGKGVSLPITTPSGSGMSTPTPSLTAPSIDDPSCSFHPTEPLSPEDFSMDVAAYLSCGKGKGKVPDSPPCLPPLAFSQPEFSYAHISWPSPSSVTDSIGSSSTSSSYGSPLIPRYQQQYSTAALSSDHLRVAPTIGLRQRSLSGSSTHSDSSVTTLSLSRVKAKTVADSRSPGNLTHRLLFKKPGPGPLASTIDVVGVCPNAFRTNDDSETRLKDLSLSYRLSSRPESASWPNINALKGKQRSNSSPLPYSVLDFALNASSDTIIPYPTLPNIFDFLPREIRVCILSTIPDLHECEHRKALRDVSWTASTASSSKNRWVGRERGVRELVKFSRVSKSWQMLISDGQLWKDLDLRSFHNVPKSVILRLASVAGPFIQRLNIAGHVFMLSSSFIEISKHLCIQPTVDRGVPATTQLTKLNVSGCTMLNMHSLHYLLRCSPLLETVVMKGLRNVSNGTCEVLAEHCRVLRVLDMGRCPNIDADGVRCIFKAAYQRGEALLLKVLRLSGMKYIDDAFMSSLGKVAPHLEVLDLSYCRQLHNSALEAFVACDEDDTEMTLGVDIVVLSAREAGREISDRNQYRRRVTRLRHLILSSCILLTDQACSNLAHSVPYLEFLELAGIGDDLRAGGLIRLFGTTAKIRRVDLEDASELTDAVIASLTPLQVGAVAPPAAPQAGQALEHLIISNTTNITDSSLLALIRNCQHLRILEADNTRIGPKIFKEFIRLSQERDLLDTKLVAVDCRAIGEMLVKEMSSRTRPRRGWRGYEARKLKYLDARDGDLEFLKMGQDECDERRVVVKTFYSWQTVDAVKVAREKKRKATSRRTANGSASSADEGSTARWWSPGGRRSGTNSPVDMANRDICTIM